MLGMNAYPREYIDACRARMDAQLAAWKGIADRANGTSELEAFEPLFFANLVLVLEQSFVRRLRGQEGKDGNPLNEVRMLSASLLQNGGILAADKTIKYDPAKSVLGLKIGDAIEIDEHGFERLSMGFFAEIQAKFG